MSSGQRRIRIIIALCCASFPTVVWGVDAPNAGPSPAPATVAPNAAPSGTTQAPTSLTPIQNLPIEDLRHNETTSGKSEAATAVTAPNPSLPRELSPWAMFLQADLVVKGVMIGLAFASVVNWTVWLYKTFELISHRARLKRDLRAIAQDTSLSAATKTLGDGKGVLRVLIAVATLELGMSRDTPDRAGIKERVASRIERVESAAVRRMNMGMGVVASIGATAPFIGLFGTVWGIMNSFIGISKSQTTNLAVVAPGIAEALLATAMGLVAAIPAVLIYNWFSRGVGVYRARVGDASAEVMRLVSRDLDRVAAPRRALAAE